MNGIVPRRSSLATADDDAGPSIGPGTGRGDLVVQTEAQASPLADRQAARHGTAGHDPFLKVVGRTIPTAVKTDAMEFGAHAIGFDMAAQALEHYRGGSGEPLELPSEALRAHPAIQRAQADNQGQLSQHFLNQPGLSDKLSALKDGESLTYPLTQTNKGINADDFSDLHYAAGRSNLDTTATLTFTRKGSMLAVDGGQAHDWHDVYDWAKGSSFFGGAMTGDEMIGLEKQGKAKPFVLRGQWKTPVRGSIPIGADGTLGIPDINWDGDKR